MKEVRPTTGKTLAALFSILGSMDGLGSHMEGQNFLDLFSGTGRVAKAAKDRGADIVTVELVRDRASEIRRTLGSDGHIQLCMDVRRALKWIEKHEMSFDIIFADPPYDMRWMEVLPTILFNHTKILKPNGIVILEHSIEEKLKLDGTTWQVFDERRYGISSLTFMRLGSDTTQPV